ncbi:MAG: hypothetical protein IJY06_06315 [Oscillospiraceae bacterium]|nr:hypothetical protein [Oscillospiraceae bacterium]
MSPMHKFKALLDRMTNSKPATMILSIAVALLIWFTISVTAYPTTPVTFYNIPVVVDTAGTAAEANGLSIVSCDVETVTVQIEGSRSKVGTLTEEDLTAHLSMQNVTAAGEYPLEISVKSSKNISFEVNSISPSRADVTFDKIETRSFPVTPDFPNIVILPGHTMNEVTCDPATIDITGPAAKLDEISKAVVRSDKFAEIDSSYALYSTDVTLYNEENSILEPDAFTMPPVNFTINIPVLTQKEVPLIYDVRNVPSNFDLEWLRERLILSADTITLASNVPTFGSQENWNLGYLKLEDIHLNYSNVFKVPVAEGVINQSGFQEVTLTLNPEGLEERTFKVSGDNISIINKPSSYDFKVITKELAISVIGPTEVLDELRTKDIVVTVDLTNYNVAQSQSFTSDSQISFIGVNNVWASGVYKIAIDYAEKEETTTEPETEE